MRSISHAKLDWRDSDTPVSIEFDDVYFSTVDGIDETRYVFLQHNGFPERFTEHPRNTLVVAETGFGTGLNLMVLWHAFREFRRRHPDAPCKRLHFVTMEKYPVTEADLAKAHRHWPEFAEQCRQLKSAYPMPIPGCHRMEFDQGQVVVDLWLGDVNQCLEQMYAPEEGLVDVWFLDGFTPSRNPKMWQEQLYEQMARLSHRNASYATFTAAGHVRRGLEKHGFTVTKDQGYGVKREMISGHFTPDRPQASRPDEVAVVGAGIAAAHTALSLVQRGIAVTLYGQDAGPADGASGNRQGALYPLMNLAEDGLSALYQQGFLLARQRLSRLVENGHSVDHDWCGVLQLSQSPKDAEKLERIGAAGFPCELVHRVDRDAASHIADLPLDRGGLFFPYGGWLAPEQLVLALLAQAQATGLLTCHWHHRLQGLQRAQAHWQLEFDQSTARHQQLVICMGHASADLAQSAPLPLQPVRGQISAPESSGDLSRLKTVLCADGYLVPALAGRLTCGASFVKNSRDSQWRSEDVEEIGGRMANSFAGSDWLAQLALDDSGRAAIRGSVRDHFPLMGPITDWSRVAADPRVWRDAPLPNQPGLHLVAGLGSRGLCSGALMAESAVSLICAEPLPLTQGLLQRLLPGRFWQRRINKGHPPVDQGQAD
ncbi:bifunctional tRNA (5-methylaminomethyl-2-thiouridine)(34)-methyltransferase MnmD/FAD-dependent 5-carboxymethylaminomethyl-2-thiouridine(34) oxidoreductase MnmC [Ferrimonas sediminicola]|uniref:bifunctional tRNA (5-methylaminomethyl-2-thiouridine)(34)-methyltransferase MnmD/FAD-dependent 5-carboxymethylaminomethyl-2-thiouridine(34) oxidoreductase MnmC n=1 Tax=Ferrimonas sediminicola TaxID=2569538 RepID=UPI00145F119C|nr:bifunctional tRNA (5-methylaminomethyl-2-thiouridine)(34)-methyltransferase MnmD/FAD-dependent 5-carboxymethylaminomethyl-2-thiouridine(34) oxidoreductase MnmC [Ferrimonas sediminicola]